MTPFEEMEQKVLELQGYIDTLELEASLMRARNERLERELNANIPDQRYSLRAREHPEVYDQIW